MAENKVKTEEAVEKAATKAKKPAGEAKKPATKTADTASVTKKAKTGQSKHNLYKRADNPERGRLKKRYVEEIIPALMKERGYTNVMQVPSLVKLTLNMRLGDIKDNSKSVNQAVKELESICGQKAVMMKAKKSVANFKLRQGQTIAAKVTLRGSRMYEFLDKLISIALPRVRDFRGLSAKSFDGRGNYSLGIKEQLIFPEISYELIEKVRGFDINIITTAESDDEARAFLQKLGMPFKS